MGPVGHTAISGALGIVVGAATGSPKAGAVALAVGVLMDADHLHDFYQWYVKGRSNKVFVLLHAWEYSAVGFAVLAAVFFHPVFLAVVLAHLVHVTTDHFHNRLHPLAYFLSFRIYKRFDAAVLTPGYDVMASYKGWPKLLPFSRWSVPWFQRRIEPWFEARVRLIESRRMGTNRADD